MRKSRVETEETRRRIVEAAAAGFRANGIEATGVAEVMSAAGLSHGGFYRHFASKDQLVAEASELALNGIIARLEAAASERQGEDAYKAVVNAYMSARHRDTPESGCPLAGMGSELVRADDLTRTLVSNGIGDFIGMLAERMGDPQDEADRSRAAFSLAAMVGALTLSRILPDRHASASLLEGVRKHIEAI